MLFYKLLKDNWKLIAVGIALLSVIGYVTKLKLDISELKLDISEAIEKTAVIQAEYNTLNGDYNLLKAATEEQNEAIKKLVVDADRQKIKIEKAQAEFDLLNKKYKKSKHDLEGIQYDKTISDCANAKLVLDSIYGL